MYHEITEARRYGRTEGLEECRLKHSKERITLYMDNLQALAEKLTAFREEHEPGLLDVAGTQWEFVASGRRENAPTLLLLSGFLGRGESWFKLITALEQDFNLLAPTYPACDGLDDITRGLESLLDKHGVEEAHIVGHSFGGMLAQHFVRQRPQRVASLVLSHTGPVDPNAGPGLLQQAGHLPLIVQRAWWKPRVTRWTTEGFQREYAVELLYSFSKEELVSRYRVYAGLGQQLFEPGDLDEWPGRSLIIESDDDPAISPERRAALKTLYPRAEVRTFAGAGHSTSTARPDEYAATIRDFVASHT